MNPVEDPSELIDLFAIDRETHLYGLADLEEPFWSSSKWYRLEGAAVGLVSVGGEWVTGYAMSRDAVQATLDLFAGLCDGLPSGTWVTGPLGLDKVVAKTRRTRPVGVHWRMVLDNPDSLDTEEADSLGLDDLDAMFDLHSSDPGSAFWMPEMLEANPFVGVWEDGRLIAAAGCHVASRRFGVAAVGGVLTRPGHRGRGLGRRVTSALCRRLWGEYSTIGLNVEVANAPALAIYDSLGFRRAFRYEETELL